MLVLLVGTLDTKGHELAFVRELLVAQGLEVVVIDAGSAGEPVFAPDIGREEVFRYAGATVAALGRRADRGEAVAAAARGVAALVVDLGSRRRIDGILSIGGSAGTVIGTAGMRALPFGLPKVMVSTLASGQTRPFVGGSDILMLHPVADIAGLNRLTRVALANGAHALAGMVKFRRREAPATPERPLVAATMFGVTTPCIDRARRQLEDRGVEVLVFHATGVGGQAMEGLVRDGQIAGLLDLTTTELADELVGGILSAGPDRLEAAVRKGIPQVVSVGALDMVNFGPRETVPERFASRQFHRHNPVVTLMRTTAEENAAIGKRMASILRGAVAPVVVMVPERGVSALDAPGHPFYDPVADGALFDALAGGLADSGQVRIERRDEHINDPAFADAAARTLAGLLGIESTG
ncbi:MAG: Tm-1-like ATP-binding domain-containing protein [Isosphaeraceae bacterium]|nr:Tm-1-like ATP-binding domain-containing protein [Isosphaeraceae bacterium]